jgi:BlaI family penicillinase repressor
MARQLPSLGDFELQVLQLVWEHEPCVERQISDAVRKERPVARTTVLKTMQRLVAKGLLVRDEGETPIRFRAAVPRQQMLPALVGQFVKHVLGGSAEPLVAYFGSSKRLSAKDFEALKAIAKKIENS